MDLLKLLHGFFTIDVWISLSYYMVLSKLIHGFLYVVTGICRSCFMDFIKLLRGFVKVFLSISCSLPNKTKVKADKDFKAC